MNFNSFEKDFDYFKETYPDLVDAYESMNDCLDNSIKSIYNAFRKSGSSSVTEYCSQVLQFAIDNFADLKTALDSIKNTDTSDTVIQYFKNVQDVYKKNGTVDITKVNHSETDEQKMIENNLKTVISIAKRYLKCGLPLEDLISAGNVGLCTAVTKYRDGKWKLRNAILMDCAGLNWNKPKKSNNDSFHDWNLFQAAQVMTDGTYNKQVLEWPTLSRQALIEKITAHISYGDIKDKIIKAIPQQETFSGDEVVKFICANVPPAKFNSVACMWIKAAILDEIYNSSKVMKGNTPIFRLDQPIKETSTNTFEAIIDICDTSKTAFENYDSKLEFTRLFNQLTEGISPRHFIIIKKFFGIDYPAAIEPKDIAFQENITTARVSQILKTSIDIMKANAKKYDLEESFRELFN